MTEKVISWRNSRASTPRAADMGVDVLRALLKFGMQRGLLGRNVAEKIGELYVNGQRAEIIWTDEDLTTFTAATGDKDAHVDDAVQLASVTGPRREGLARLTWAGVRGFANVHKAAKKSRGRRRFATVQRIPELDAVLARVKLRRRGDRVETVLVNPAGEPWNLDTLSKEVSRIAQKAGIIHLDDETGTTMRKHLHDVRGTFATRLVTATDLTSTEIAAIMGCSEEEVTKISRIYVDDVARTVALGRGIARGV